MRGCPSGHLNSRLPRAGAQKSRCKQKGAEMPGQRKGESREDCLARLKAIFARRNSDPEWRRRNNASTQARRRKRREKELAAIPEVSPADAMRVPGVLSEAQVHGLLNDLERRAQRKISSAAKTLLARKFSSVAAVDPPDGLDDPCWLWPGKFYPPGYGIGALWWGSEGGVNRAHRLSALLFGLADPPIEIKDKHVLHSCHRPACFPAGGHICARFFPGASDWHTD